MSPVSFAVLSGAGIVKGKRKTDTEKAAPIYTHANYDIVVEKVDGKLVAILTSVDRNNAQIVVSREAPVYPVVLDSAGAQKNYLSAVTETQVMIYENGALSEATIDNQGLVTGSDGKDIAFILGTYDADGTKNPDTPYGDSRQDSYVVVGDTVRLDLYEAHYEEAYEMSIAADEFPGYYYIEASTLFRDEATGVDFPAEFIIPRGKIQGNFTFEMNNSGDPS